jgi:hypothetical protein
VLLISWPASAEGFVLQTTDQITGATVWTNVAAQPLTNGQEKTVPMTAPNARSFFRLIKP